MSMSKAKLKHLRDLIAPLAAQARTERLVREEKEAVQKQIKTAKDKYNRINAPHPLDVAVENERIAKQNYKPVKVLKKKIVEEE